jgi:hypothetical protein
MRRRLIATEAIEHSEHSSAIVFLTHLQTVAILPLPQRSK